MIDAAVAGQPLSHWMRARLGLARPIVAIGAPVEAYYPDVARRHYADLLDPARKQLEPASAY